MASAPYAPFPPTPKEGEHCASGIENSSKKVKAATDGQPFRQQENPLASASLLSVISTQWLQPLISLGAKKIIEKEDVWPVCRSDSCLTLSPRFEAAYGSTDRQDGNDNNHSSGDTKAKLTRSRVARALIKTFRRELLIVCAQYTIYIGTMTLQPFISQAVLDFLNDRDNVFGIQSGYALVALMTVVSFFGVTCLNYGVFVLSRVGINMRSVMMDAVYTKSLRLSCVGRQEYTTGEITTLMSVDSERLFHGAMTSPWAFFAPLAFVVTIVLIACLFDIVSAVCGLVLLVVIMTTSIHLGNRIGQLQDQLLLVVDERVRVTSESLQGIRVMKFYGWEDSLASRVQKIREVEIQLYRRFHRFQMLNAALLFLTPVFLAGVVIGAYVPTRGNLTVTEVYTLIAIVNISRLGVNMFPEAVAALSQAGVTFGRLDKFLASDEVEADPPSSADHQTVGSIVVKDGQFEWPTTNPVAVTGADEAIPVADKRGNVPQVDVGFRLIGVNLEINAGSMVMIVGSVGAGKSSLLNALLGEMTLVHGSMARHGEIAYVSQQAWIRNANVKDNILFEASFDPYRYSQVLQATQLAQDLDALPGGDHTEIGERGINLSGGQKARVSIARALYRSNYDILMLDDPLSAVDPHVAHAIFEQSIMGLAKEKTRLLVLNSHYDLLKHADKVVVVRDGRIVGDGSYDEIVSQFPELTVEGSAVSHQTSAKSDEADSEKQSVEKPPADQSNGTDTDVAAPSASGESRLVQEEDRVKGKVTGQTYKAYFDETGYNGLAVVAVIVVVYSLSQASRVIVDWWPGNWARNMPRDGIDPTYSGTRFGMLFLGFIVLCTLLTIGRGLLVLESCIRSSANLHNELFRRVLSAPVNLFFDVTPMGRILNRFSNDLDQLDSQLAVQYQGLLQNLGVFLGSLAVCAATSLWVALSYLPMLVIFVVTGLYFKKTSREVKRLDGITRTPIFNLFGETLGGLTTLRAFRMQDKFVQLNRAAIDENTSFYLGYWSTGRWLAVRFDWLSVVVIFVVTLYVVVSKGQIGAVLAGISLTYSLMLTSIVQTVVRSMDTTDNCMTSVERLLYFRGIPTEDDSSSAAVTPAWPSSGTIQFRNLHLKYRPELPLVLRGVNMEISAGQKIGICGRTGAGKSSLMIALFRICEFEAGTVMIDGVDIQTVGLGRLRRSLAIIPQDPVLYSGSLRSNLDPFEQYSDDDIWTSLKRVHLAESVLKWGSGLDFVVSECGDNLSVGQRQLVCIARALLKNSKIVVLDEATANVDSATDNLIQTTIQETFVTNTVLTIAHRIHTIMHCDRIAVMDAGQVVEFGSPKELLQQPTTIFSSLVNRSAAKTQLD